MVLRRKSKRRKVEKRSPGLVVAGRPESIIAEQFRTLRTNIQFSMEDQDLKTLVITSAAAEEGKSVVAANLATAFALEDYRVLLVDADLRKPTVHTTYRLGNTKGLTTLLRNRRAELVDVIHETDTEDLYLLTSGPMQSNPAEHLASNRMTALTAKMEEEFDLVIFDMPPLLPVTDAQVMAKKVDGVVFVVPMGEANKEDIVKSKEILQMADANVLGAVFNQVEDSGASYYYYGEEE